ncbi:MAG: hypothetical protein ACP5RP_04360 [Candidatus Micrarchaeia archaeon]
MENGGNSKNDVQMIFMGPSEQILEKDPELTKRYAALKNGDSTPMACELCLDIYELDKSYFSKYFKIVNVGEYLRKFSEAGYSILTI